MTAEIVSPARLKARQAEAARKERETLRPYQIDGCYFMATKEDAETIEGAEPFEGEKYTQPTVENGLKQVECADIMACFMKAEGNTRLPYRKFMVETDDFKEYWLEKGAKTSVAKLTKKAPAKKAAPKKAE